MTATWFRPFRRRPLLWTLPLGAIVVNLAWLSAFGSGARLRAADLDSRLSRARADSAEVTARLAEREKLWITATENEERVERLRREAFSSERARLTAMVREVKDLATRSGLAPSAIRYPEETFSDFGLSRRSIDFAVDGSYADLRTFLHLLELTPTFVTVDEIAVSERDAGRLGISLRLSTLFNEGGEYESAAAPAPAVATGSVAAPPAVPPIEVPPYQEDAP